MLDTSPGNLYEEIKAAERFRDSHLEHYADVISEYVGPAGPGGLGRGEASPENHVYEYLSLVIPRLIHDNPRVAVKTRLPVTQGPVAKALEHGLNRWARDTNMRSVLMRVAYDMIIAYGVVLTAQRPSPGYDPRSKSRAYWPNCYRLSPKRFFMDPLALSANESRYMGHMWIRDKKDLVEEAKNDPSWNSEAVEQLAEGSGISDAGRNKQAEEKTPTRNEVVGYDVWVPEVQYNDAIGPEDGFHGTIYTVSVGQSGKGKSADFIREPRAYYGPPSGPYSFFGGYYVPDSPYPLSPIMATVGQVDELNDHVRSAARSASQYKRLILVDSKSKKLMQDIKSQPDNFVVPVEGLDRDRVVPIELGGITNQQVSYIQMARERLDRNSGVHDAMRGNVTGAATATEVSIAESSSTVRLAYIKQQFQESVRGLLDTAGWYLYHDERVVFPLGSDAAEDLGLQEPYYVGGEIPGQTGGSYDDLELEIDAYSMERTDETLQQRRAMEAFQVISSVAATMPQAPYVAWDALLSQIGDALNMPHLGELIDQNMLQGMVQQQQAQQQAMTMQALESGSAPKNQSQGAAPPKRASSATMAGERGSQAAQARGLT